jgi:hypothetical protein
MAKRKLVHARTEAEEAAWFEQNQDHLLKLFDQAAKQGALRVGGKSIGISINKQTGALVRPRSQKVMLRMPVDDLERARRLAASKGIGYQTYIKMIVKQGLDQAEAVRRRA